MKMTLMQAGYCTQSEYLLKANGSRKRISVPALFALLEHPEQGLILFDTGYTPRFFSATRYFPYRFYRWVTPVYVDEAETAHAQLEKQGIAAEAIRSVIISHFHADHIAGLRDFSQAQYLFLDEAYQAVQARRSWSALKAGFLPDLLPDDFEQRSNPLSFKNSSRLSMEYAPFRRGIDVFGDKSLIAVSLPGHAWGQIGIFLQTENQERVLLAADACWNHHAYQELIFPHPLTYWVMSDLNAYRETLLKLHQLNHNHPALRIIPAHCGEEVG